MENNKDRNEVLAAVKENGYALDDADESLQKDKEIVLAAIKENGRALEYADESFRKDKEIVLEAVKQTGAALMYADESFQKDREIVLSAVKESGNALNYADKSLKKDKEIVLEAVKQSGLALKYADESFRMDREIVLEAVKTYGEALKYADESFRMDREIVLEAVKQDGCALEYADDSFKADREVVLDAVKMPFSNALLFADDTLKADREIVLEAFKSESEEPLELLYSIDNPSQEMLDTWIKNHGSVIERQHSAFEFDMEEVNEGQKIIIVFCAIIGWIRNEKELKDETWNKAYSSIEALIFEGYNIESGIDDTGDDYFESAKKNGILLANAYFLEGQEAAFRSFIKSVAISPTVFDLSSEEIGDLTLLLLLLCRFVEDNEDSDVSQKYIEDIENTCRYQLDADEIYDETLEVANEQYSNSSEL